MVRTIVLVYFNRTPLGNTIKANGITFQTVDSEISSILIIYKKV